MLDPTTDGFFVDENGVPLSLLEMRERFANAKFITYVSSTDSLKDLKKLKNKYVEENVYICKNLFFFAIDQDATFGATDKSLKFIPINYSVKAKLIANAKYRIENLPDEYQAFLPQFEKRLGQLSEYEEDRRTDINSMLKSPVK